MSLQRRLGAERFYEFFRAKMRARGGKARRRGTGEGRIPARIPRGEPVSTVCPGGLQAAPPWPTGSLWCHARAGAGIGSVLVFAWGCCAQPAGKGMSAPAPGNPWPSGRLSCLRLTRPFLAVDLEARADPKPRAPPRAPTRGPPSSSGSYSRSRSRSLLTLLLPL